MVRFGRQISLSVRFLFEEEVARARTVDEKRDVWRRILGRIRIMRDRMIRDAGGMSTPCLEDYETMATVAVQSNGSWEATILDWIGKCEAEANEGNLIEPKGSTC